MTNCGQRGAPGKHVAVVGAGGNIGSHLVRMAGVGRVTLVDCDVYEERNLAGQDVTPRDLGRAKALVQARALRRRRPDLDVRAVCTRVQDVPLGRLRGAAVLGCLDGREARRYVSEACWRLGGPYLDAGVLADGLLARVDVYVPAEGAPCMQRSWDERDYALLEQAYPCDPGAAGPAPTNAPSALGALAASLLALECSKVLAGRWDESLAGKRLMIEAQHHRHYVTAFRRNPHCRFDHAVWDVRPLGRDAPSTRLRDLLGADGAQLRAGSGARFVTRLICPACRAERRVLRLQGRLAARQLACRACGSAMRISEFEILDSLDLGALGRGADRVTLASLGLREGDVFGVHGADGATYYEIGCDEE